MSKFKATATEHLPGNLAEYLSSTNFSRRLLKEVLGAELRVKNPLMRPAEHYMQRPDFSVAAEENYWGVELALTKVSVLDGRHFAGALDAMVRILREAIHEHVPVGTHIQIYCVIATDVPVPGRSTTLFEMEQAIWEEGQVNTVVA